MKTFDEIASKWRRTNVTVDEDGVSGAGVVVADGRASEAVLTSNEMLGAERRDRNGWFDLRLKTTNGNGILLHNALTVTSRMPTARGGQYEDTTFPNLIIFESHCLDRGGRVKAIRFAADKLHYFFHYRHIESHYLSNPPLEILRALKNIRKLPQYYPREYDIFRPTEVRIVHRFPRPVRFRVADRTYGVDVWPPGGTEFGSDAHLQIGFDDPVSIDTALDRVWEWRRFFSQCALEALPLRYLAGRGRKAGAGFASFYLPNVAIQPASNASTDGFHPSEAPLSGWQDRTSFAAVMKQWLQREEERSRFRANLDRVIEESKKRSELDHITTLCAGIESLSEFQQAAVFKAGDIEALVEGASSAARAASIDVTDDRLRGLLSMLNSQGLPQRLKMLGRVVQPDIGQAKFADLILSTLDLRRVAAHGHPVTDLSLPKLAPTIEALLAACVIWDLKTSGMPIGTSPARLKALWRAEQSIGELTRLEQKGDHT